MVIFKDIVWKTIEYQMFCKCGTLTKPCVKHDDVVFHDRELIITSFVAL